MKKITDSFIFQQAIKREATRSAIKNIIAEMQKLPDSAIEEQMSLISKKIKYPSKDKMMELLGAKLLVPIYNPTLGIPKYLNTFMKAENGKIICVCDTTNFSRMSSNGTSDIQSKTLFTLLQNGTVYYELFENWNRYTNNVNIVKNGSIIYANIVGKVLDKLYGIKIDSYKHDLVFFLLAKFFIVNMCDRIPTGTVDQIAYKACPNKSNFDLIIAEASQLNDNIFDNVDMFIKGLSTLNMPNLNIRIVLENFAKMFGESTLLALDYLPAFFSMIFGVAVSGSIAKDYIIEGICGKDISSLYVEFFKLS